MPNISPTHKHTKIAYYAENDCVDGYDYRRFVRGGGRYVAAVEEATFIRCLQEFDGQADVLLDCPCGTGRLVPLEKQFSNKVYCADTSDNMLEYATRHNPHALLNEDASSLKFGSGTIDIWVSARFFFHFKDLSPFFQEANRVLKPEGLLIFDVFRLSPRSLLPNAFLGGSTYNHSHRYISKLAQRFGFKVVYQTEKFVIPTYVASFLPHRVTTALDKHLSKLLPHLKTKRFYCLQKI